MHLVPLFAFVTGVTRLRHRAVRRRSTSRGCSSSPPATTATSRTAPTRSGRVIQFVLAFGGATAAQKGAAVVGRAPPPPPPLLRHAERHPLAAARASGGATWLDPLPQVPTTPTSNAIKDFAKYPGAALAQQALPGAADACSASACFADRRLERAGVGLLPVAPCCSATARSPSTRSPRLRPPPLRDHRHQPQLARCSR